MRMRPCQPVRRRVLYISRASPLFREANLTILCWCCISFSSSGSPNKASPVPLTLSSGRVSIVVEHKNPTPVTRVTVSQERSTSDTGRNLFSEFFLSNPLLLDDFVVFKLLTTIHNAVMDYSLHITGTHNQLNN